MIDRCPVTLKVRMVFKYVDDFRVVMTPIPLGYYYCLKTSKWIYSDKRKQREPEGNVTPKSKTKELLLVIMNSRVSRRLRYWVSAHTRRPTKAYFRRDHL